MITGLYLQMCGIHHFIDRYTNLKKTRLICDICMQMLLVALYLWLHLPTVFFLLLIYSITVAFCWITSSKSYQLAIRGLAAVLLMVLMELASSVFGGSRVAFQDSVIRAEYNMPFVVRVLWMLMVQVCVTSVGEIWKLRKKKWRYFYMIIAIKRIVEALWLYRIMDVTDFAKENLPWLFLFIGSLLTDYYLMYDAEIRKLVGQEMTRRIRTPLNREEYYARMEEEHLQIRSLFHDMKNQLMIMEGSKENQTPATQNFIHSFGEQIKNLGSFYHTGNAELDLILFDCRTRAEERKIQFDVVIQEGCLSFMAQEDINAIFINAVMNAIEACEKIEQGERKIQIQVGSRLNDVMMSFKNTVSHTASSRRLQTTKLDKKFHGLGIPSIQRAADKYQGYVSISEDDQYFQLGILFVREE